MTDVTGQQTPDTSSPQLAPLQLLDSHADGSTTNGPESTAVAPESVPVEDSSDAKVLEEVREVLFSEIGVSTLLNKLKQSIGSAKEFATFLKKRSAFEDDHAKGLKKLCRNSQDTITHADHRQGTFKQSYDELLMIHDRMAENGIQFSVSLQQMHEDLLEVATVSEKHRKGWKTNGLEPEQRLSALENAVRKSKAKYDSLAEEYDRVKTGEARQGAKVFGFKGPKSAAQQEEDLFRKVQAADSDYFNRVQTYQAEKANVEATTRPDAVQALQDLIKECDAATTLQMQKFASFNEKLLLSNGLVISPLKSATLPGQHSRSLKEAIQAVKNKDDFENYVKSFYTKVPPKSAAPKYEKNPVLNPTSGVAALPPPQTQSSRPATQQAQQPPPIQTQVPVPGRTGTFDTMSPPTQDSPHTGFGAGPATSASQRGFQGPGHDRSFSSGGLLDSPGAQTHGPLTVRNSAQAPSPQSRFNGSMSSAGSPQTGAPQLGALPFQGQGQPPYSPQEMGPSVRSVSPPAAMPGPMSRAKQVFGVSLARLYERDANAVPMVVYQCIQAVDLFGLNVEGIYRLSGSSTHVNKLKNLFDTDSESRILDFRNPENFFHDVNSVAGLLKQFLRDLPDPLLTGEHYLSFIDAAKNDDDTVRRDSLHAIINGLPDPNYATLRALMIHLSRVIESSGINRMNSQNLAIVFGPTLMGTAPGSNIADAGWQVKVVDTILQNVYQIFDED